MTLNYTGSDDHGTMVVHIPTFGAAEARSLSADGSSVVAPRTAVTWVPDLIKLASRRRVTLDEMRDALGVQRQRVEEWAHSFYDAGIFDRCERPGTGRSIGTPKAYEYWATTAFGGEA